MSNPDSLRKALEFIKRHCANIIRTNSRDRDDWAEDMAYIGKVASDALEPSEAAVVADSDGDDYTPALSLHAPDARIPVGLARNHSAESAWRVGWMRGWMEARRTADAPQPTPQILYTSDPQQDEILRRAERAGLRYDGHGYWQASLTTGELLALLTPPA